MLLENTFYHPQIFLVFLYSSIKPYMLFAVMNRTGHKNSCIMSTACILKEHLQNYETNI